MFLVHHQVPHLDLRVELVAQVIGQDAAVALGRVGLVAQQATGMLVDVLHQLTQQVGLGLDAGQVLPLQPVPIGFGGVGFADVAGGAEGAVVHVADADLFQRGFEGSLGEAGLAAVGVVAHVHQQVHAVAVEGFEEVGQTGALEADGIEEHGYLPFVLIII